MSDITAFIFLAVAFLLSVATRFFLAFSRCNFSCFDFYFSRGFFFSRIFFSRGFFPAGPFHADFFLADLFLAGFFSFFLSRLFFCLLTTIFCSPQLFPCYVYSIIFFAVPFLPCRDFMAPAPLVFAVGFQSKNSCGDFL